MAGRLDMSLEPRGGRRAAVLRGDWGARPSSRKRVVGLGPGAANVQKSRGRQARSFEFSVA